MPLIFHLLILTPNTSILLCCLSQAQIISLDTIAHHNNAPIWTNCPHSVLHIHTHTHTYTHTLSHTHTHTHTYTHTHTHTHTLTHTLSHTHTLTHILSLSLTHTHTHTHTHIPQPPLSRLGILCHSRLSSPTSWQQRALAKAHWIPRFNWSKRTGS